VDPQQQFWLIQPEADAFAVYAGERGMHLAQPGASPVHLWLRAVGANPDEFDGPGEPAPGLVWISECGVLPGPEHHSGMQGLHVHGADAGDPHHRLAEHPPGDRTWAEESVISAIRRRAFCRLPLGQLRWARLTRHCG